MELQVWSFSKKRKSTKIPSGAGVTINADLKHSTSFENPIFRISGSEIVGITPANITYVKDVDHGNYYFVENCTVWPHDVYELNCVMDPMASHRTEILGSTQYVLYSASKYYPFIPDPRLPQQSEVIAVGHGSSFYPFTESGYYVVSCISKRDDGRGEEFITNYMVNSLNLSGLVEMLINTTWADDLINTMGKPFDCITSIRFIPVSDSTVRNALSMSYLSDILLGKENMLPAQGYIFPAASNIVSRNETFTPSWHYAQDFRLANPYTTASLYIPGYGVVEINPLQCAYSLTVYVDLDAVTGDVTVYLYGKNEALDPRALIATLNFNVAVQIPLAQLGSNPSGVITSVGVAAGAALSLGLGLGGLTAVGAMAGGIGNAIIAANTQTPSAKGSISGRSWLSSNPVYLIERYINTVDIDSMKNTQGRPLMEENVLSTLSGYCQCQNAQVNLDCYAGERAEIEGILNSGFYIE